MVAPSPCLYTGQVTRSRSVDAAARLHTPLHGPPQETGNIGVKHPSGYWVGFHFQIEGFLGINDNIIHMMDLPSFVCFFLALIFKLKHP